MKFILTVLLLAFLTFAISFGIDQGTVTIELNASQTLWGSPVRASGKARVNGSPLEDASVSITVDKETNCPNTDSKGEWECVFNAPLELGKYDVIVSVSKDGIKITNSTRLEVKISYGVKPPEASNKVAYEAPIIIQEMSGKIRRVFARVIVW